MDGLIGYDDWKTTEPTPYEEPDNDLACKFCGTPIASGEFCSRNCARASQQ